MKPWRTRLAEMFERLPVAVPLARRIRLDRIHAAAVRTATNGPVTVPTSPPLFVVGCGRSGTTILGNLIGIHPAVTYLNEPYHLWAAVSPRLDVTNLHVRVEPQLCWTDPATDDERKRFLRVFGPLGRERRLVEKTPHNIYRVDWIRSILPEARFVNIRRSGVEVVRSIDRIASTSTYRMMRPDYNQWWGSHGSKWTALARECPSLGHDVCDVERLRTSRDRGAYEWLTSLREADRLASTCGDLWLDVDHRDLCRAPREVLTRICEHGGLPPEPQWLDRCEQEVVERESPPKTVVLDDAIRDHFNQIQERLGFGGRAVAADAAS